MAVTRDSKRHFTIMVIPHSERSVRSFRLPVAYMEASLALLGLGGLALLIFANSYQKMTTNMGELQLLRQTTTEQRDQLDFLSKETETVQESLKQLEELDRQVREMLKLGPKLDPTAPANPDAVGLAPEIPNYRPTLRDTARIASVTGEGPGLVSGSNLMASIGGGTPLADASRGDLEASAQMLLALEQLKTEIDSRQSSMQELQSDIEEKLRYLAAKPSIWPLYGSVTSNFGYRRNPYGWGSEFHPGLDIAAPYGTEVRATGDGVVVESGWDGGYGKKVTLDHGYGFRTVYGHNSRNAVEVGDRVKKGEVIAYVGMTGRTTGPHVHYEVLLYGKLMDPRKYLSN